jgi:multidrug efflux pump subunit AcrB
VALKLSGQSINLMTLGGLALAVGMLVDDATVEVENIHRNHARGKALGVAILDGARQIALPTLVGTLAICIVFSPVLGLSGVPQALFTPLALAVVYAMLASSLLSRTLVPSMALHLLPEDPQEHHGDGPLGRFTSAFERGFEHLREGYRRLLGRIVERRWLVLTNVMVMVAGSMALLWLVGEDFFPAVDTGMIKLHVRAPVGTRLEETSRIVDAVEADIRRVIPAHELSMICDHIGLPASWMLPTYQTDSVGPQDADLQIQLHEHHHATAAYVRAIRARLRRDLPDVLVYSHAADIVSQVLNFGQSAPIDVQIVSRNVAENFKLAQELKQA